MLADSGAGLHACPASHAPWIPVRQKPGAVAARTASGAPVKHLGFKTVAYRFEDGSVCKITFQVMEVEKPVLSVGHLNSTGHSVVLEPGRAEIRKNSERPSAALGGAQRCVLPEGASAPGKRSGQCGTVSFPERWRL